MEGRKKKKKKQKWMQSVNMASSSSNTHFWSEAETAFMLIEMKTMKHQNGNIFKRVPSKMAEVGYVRTVEQLRCRWKSLRSAYYKTTPVGPTDIPVF